MTKGSAISELAKGLAAEQGSDGARTRAAPGISAPAVDEGEAAFEAEMDLFGSQAIAPPKRPVGRPAGAQDRSTVQLAAWMRAKGYRDPAEFLAAIVSMDANDLHRIIRAGADDVAVLDAVKLQIAAAKELMPYVHRKRPIEVEHTGDGSRPLIIVADDLRKIAAQAGAAMSIHDSETNQTLISAIASGSHDRGSQGDG